VQKAGLFCNSVTSRHNRGGDETQKSPHGAGWKGSAMDQRERDEAAIRDAVLVCVNALRSLSGAHQHYAQTMVNSELNMLGLLENEQANREHFKTED
jgi:hypothetical protein